jgi:hypothetical protein
MAGKSKTKPKAEAKAEATPIVPVEKRTVVTDADGNKKYKCQYCGKWIKFASWEEAMAGDYCQQLRDKKGWNDESLREHRLSMSADEVPVLEDGRSYVKVAVLHKICVKNSIPVSRMVKAFGGDRSPDGPLHPKFQVVYVGRARWLHPDCAEEWGFNFMRTLTGGRSTAQTEVENALS